MHKSIEQQLLNNSLMGIFFGYPSCCISWFVERAKKIDIAVAQGADIYKEAELPENQNGYVHGFIPCPRCAKITSPGAEHNLIKNRICKSKYPNGHYTTHEFENFVNSYVNEDSYYNFIKLINMK